MKRLTLGIFLFVSALAAKTFTLEQVLSAPFPSELVAAPGGGKVAWMLNERGARNVWIAAAPGLERRPPHLLHRGRRHGYRATARGHPMAAPWSTRAAATWSFWAGPIPTPAPTPAGVEQAIWIVASRPGAAQDRRRPFARAFRPKAIASPTSASSQIWLAPLSGSEKPVLLYRARSGVTSAEIAWSPDGSQAGFCQRSRQPQLHRRLRFRGQER